MKPIILASSSLRRKRLLEEAGYKFIVDSSNFDESKVTTRNPHEMVKQLSVEKAREIAKRHSNSIIIGADTTVFCDGQILEKPKDTEDAKRMLQFLSGKAHVVITGVTVIDTETNQETTDIEESKVFFKKLTDEQIDEYVKTGQALDKAGAYAIQEGLSQNFIEKTEGEYTNIVGLPRNLVKQLLSKIS
jgi:septum formation protein